MFEDITEIMFAIPIESMIIDFVLKQTLDEKNYEEASKALMAADNVLSSFGTSNVYYNPDYNIIQYNPITERLPDV